MKDDESLESSDPKHWKTSRTIDTATNQPSCASNVVNPININKVSLKVTH